MEIAKKKTTRKKKTTSKKSAVDKRKINAEKKLSALVAKLKLDLAATRVILNAARKGASQEIKLARSAAKAEIAVLKDQLNVAMKREKALRTMAEQKAKVLLATGRRWEKEQLAKIRKMLGR